MATHFAVCHCCSTLCWLSLLHTCPPTGKLQPEPEGALSGWGAAARSLQRLAALAVVLGLPLAAAMAAGVFGGGVRSSLGVQLPNGRVKAGAGSDGQAAILEGAHSSSSSSSRSSRQQQQQRREEERVRNRLHMYTQPVNSSMEAEALAELCEAVKEQVGAQVVLVCVCVCMCCLCCVGRPAKLCGAAGDQVKLHEKGEAERQQAGFE